MADPRSFLALYTDHYPSLYAHALRHGVPTADADDLVQETAAVLWTKFDTFQDGSNFRAWAHAVMDLEIRKWRHARGRSDRVLHLSPEAEADLAGLEQVDADPTDLRDRLRNCLSQLGAQARRLIDWHYGEALDFDALAVRCGSSAATLRVRLHRIRRALHRCLEQNHG